MSHEFRTKYFGTPRDSELWVEFGRGTRLLGRESVVTLGRIGNSQNIRYLTQTDLTEIVQPENLSDLQFARILLNRLDHV